MFIPSTLKQNIAGAGKEDIGENRKTALHFAAEGGFLNIVRFLVYNCKVEIDAEDN